MTSVIDRKDSSFSLLLFELGLSSAASSIFVVSILWISITSTGSPLITGVTTALMATPLLLNMVVGAAVDRAGKKKAIAICATLLKASAPVLLLGTLFSGIELVQILSLFASALAYGFSIDFLVVIRVIWWQRLLSRPAYLKGMSITNLVGTGSRIVGYFSSAFIIPYSAEASILLTAAIYLASIVPILLIRNVNDVRKYSKVSHLLKEGFSYLKQNHVAFNIILISGISGLFLGMTDSSSTVLISQKFLLDSSFLSYTFISISSGHLLGSLASAYTGSVKKVGRVLIFIYFLSGLFLLYLGIFPGIPALICIFLGIGVLLGFGSPLLTASLIGNVEKERIGTVQGAMDTLGTSFNSLSGLIAGLIMTISLPQNVFLVMASGMFVLAVLILRMKALTNLKT